MKTVIKVISVILSFLMVMAVFSVANPTIAEAVNKKTELDIRAEEIYQSNKANIKNDMVEIVSERDRFTKVFSSIGGTKTAVISSTPIHYETADGWKDIDNTLSEDTTSSNYINKSNDFKIKIPNELTEKSSLEIGKDDYKISFTLKGTDIFKEKKLSRGQKKAKTQQNNETQEYDFLNKDATVLFENVGSNTDIEYTVTSTGIKENIILSVLPEEKPTYTYSIKVDNLIGVLNNDKSVSFMNEKGEIIFMIPTPVMYDANNATSRDITVDFAEAKNEYILTYTPSYDWLSEATYPVVVDPYIYTYNYDYNITDVSVMESQPNKNLDSDESLVVGRLSGKESISYFDVAVGRYLDSGLAIKNILLYVYTGLYTSPETVENFSIAAYPIVGEWNESTVTYNTKPTLDTSLLLDKRIYSEASSGSYSMFDITEAFSANNTKYNGVALKMVETTDNCAALLLSSEDSYEEMRQPYCIIEYHDTRGVEEQFDYHVNSAGRAGTVYYNDYTNQVYIERADLGISGINMPVQIKSYFNSAVGSPSVLAFFFNYSTFGLGYGWTTNYNQYVEYFEDVNDSECILYHNSEGKHIYFKKTDTIQNGERKWTELTDEFSGDSGYELWLDTSYESDILNNRDKITIFDSTNQTYEFNDLGFLTKISSADENSTAEITISYINTTYIDKITDGVGREYRFNYNENEMLESIQAYTASGNSIKVCDKNDNIIDYKVSYTYTDVSLNGNILPVLSSVTYPDGETVYYTVSEDLISVKNIDGYTMEYAFSGIGDCNITEKVYSADGMFTVGATLNVSRVNAYQKTFTDNKNVSITKQFDLYGRTNCVINSDGTYEVRTFSEDVKASGRIYDSLYIYEENEYIPDGENLVDNGSFDVDLSSWLISDSSKIKRVAGVDFNPNSNVAASLYFDSAPENYQYAIHSISVPDGVTGDNYRFSFATKYDEVHQVEDELYVSAIYIYARAEDNSWKSVANIFPNPFNNNWQKNSCDFSIDFDYTEIEINIIHCCQYGRTWFDDFSLINTFMPSEDESPSDSSSDSQESGSCTCEYCENNCTCDHDGTTVCTPETCPDCGECTCDGCSQYDCPCRDCSDSCTMTACNRGYNYDSDSEGSYFTITDGEKEMKMTRNVEGNYYGSQTDINGLYTGYNYDQTNGQLKSSSDGNDYVTSYSYDAMSRLTSVTKSVSDLSSGNKMTTEYAYENDRIKSITHNGYSYNYEYDIWGNNTSVKVGAQSIVDYSYGAEENRSRINRITYGNGDYTEYNYSSDGIITRIKSYLADNSLTADYEYTYDDNYELTKIKNNIENTEIRYTDSNTSLVMLNGESETDDFILYSVGVDENNETVENFDGLVYTVTDRLTGSDALKGTTTSASSITTDENEYKFSYETDYFGRKNNQSFSYTYYEDADLDYKMISDVEYGYKDVSSTQTTNLINYYKTSLKAKIEVVDEALVEEMPEETEMTVNEAEYEYNYDPAGNITSVSVTQNGATQLLCSCVYDEAGQLVRENNFGTGKTYIYAYDKGGNIVSKTRYVATEGSLGEVLSVDNYTYDGTWKDKLSSFSGTAISTDEIGNPLNYVGYNIFGEVADGTLEWNGRQLTAIQQESQRYEYTYDSNGLRTTMKKYDINGDLEQTLYYVWDGNNLVGYYVFDETGEIEVTVKLLYDNAGESVGYLLSDRVCNKDYTFSFQKNMQGDVTGVYNDDYGFIMEYSYDAWGNVTVEYIDGSVNQIYAAVNAILYTPITYRGYMYDPYSGLYYLQSRYYNPLYGRFLNADTTDILETTQGTVHGANLFAYCNNNPINRVDRTGYLSIYEQNSDGSYRGWVGVGVQICIVPSIMHFGYNFGAEAIRFFPNNNFNNYNTPWFYKFGGWGTSVSFNVADMVAALMFGNPLSLIKSILLNNGAGFTIVFSVFLVFAKRLTSPNDYEGPFLVQQFNLPFGVLSVAHDEKNEVLTIGFGITIISGYVLGGFSAFQIGSIGYGNSKLNYYLWEV